MVLHLIPKPFFLPQLVVLSLVAACAMARPDKLADSDEFIPILRDDRVHEEDGTFSVDVETGNGIQQSMSGSPSGPEGAVVSAGEVS